MSYYSVLFLLGLFVFSVALQRRLVRCPPLPPGPPADPLIGHLRIMPSERQEMIFREWGNKYGDVIYLRFPGRSVILLNSVQATVDLYEKRSSNYSDRPKFPIYELMGWFPNLGFLPYGDRFRKHRKIFHSYFNQTACRSLQYLQTQNAYILLKNLLANNNDHEWQLTRFATSIVIRVAYGHQILSDDDEYIRMVNDTGTGILQVGPPGSTMVDFFPFLRHFPSWFPGTHYAYAARSWRWAVRKLYDLPFEHIKHQMANGTAEPSLLVSLLEASNAKELLDEEHIDDVKGTAAAMHAAGTETTWSTLLVFLMTMLLYPECQKKAQEEIDRIVGSERLPQFTDRDQLPYVECVVQEVLRWHPVVSLGLPHRVMEDDVYNGMFIPKGSLVITNILGMTLDENTYESPTVFNPSRFLPKPDGLGEPVFDAAFGFGRRICPGRYLAKNTLWIAIVSMLATLDICPALDENGLETLPAVDFTEGITSRPKPFSCRIKSRSKGAEQLILQATA